mmetsp:Transcript_64461/g.141366  ORF Transcript_64461/g.141366 Transcript_64461/m.141366 type:complete len:237 (-) Transcript_64461:17-727(-)
MSDGTAVEDVARRLARREVAGQHLKLIGAGTVGTFRAGLASIFKEKGALDTGTVVSRTCSLHLNPSTGTVGPGIHLQTSGPLSRLSLLRAATVAGALPGAVGEASQAAGPAGLGAWFRSDGTQLTGRTGRGSKGVLIEARLTGRAHASGPFFLRGESGGTYTAIHRLLTLHYKVSLQIHQAFPHSTDGLIRHPALPGIGIFLQPLAGCVPDLRCSIILKVLRVQQQQIGDIAFSNV